jgi:hypothetical protein
MNVLAAPSRRSCGTKCGMHGCGHDEARRSGDSLYKEPSRRCGHRRGNGVDVHAPMRRILVLLGVWCSHNVVLEAKTVSLFEVALSIIDANAKTRAEFSPPSHPTLSFMSTTYYVLNFTSVRNMDVQSSIATVEMAIMVIEWRAGEARVPTCTW